MREVGPIGNFPALAWFEYQAAANRRVAARTRSGSARWRAA